MTGFDKLMLSVMLTAFVCHWAIRNEDDMEAQKKVISFFGGFSLLALVARLPWIMF